MVASTSIRARGDLQFRRELLRQAQVDLARAGTAAGSGRPTSSMSAADPTAALLGGYLKLDFRRPDEASPPAFSGLAVPDVPISGTGAKLTRPIAIDADRRRDSVRTQTVAPPRSQPNRTDEPTGGESC